MKSVGFRALLGSSAAWLVLTATPALAQAAPDQEESDAAPEDKTEIVVTGTLLRGIAPPGSQTLAVTRDDAIATGATTTAQLLANIPQVGDFQRRPVTQGVQNTQLTVNHPDLRGLGANILTGGSSATLLLLDGHRLPGMGVRQTIPDSDAIPPGAIERVEIVPDGGSSTYGADAVGGVINYITRKRFNGIDASANYGFAADYKTVSFDITAGKDWGSGSFYATYSFNWHDEIYGRDRDYIQNRAWTVAGQPLGDLTCNPGNILAGTGANARTYALPSLTVGIGARCDNAEDATFYPSERRHSVFAGFTQELTDNLEISVKGFFTNRFNKTDGGPLTGTATIYGPGSATIPAGFVISPYYRSTGDLNANISQTINLNFIPLLGNSTLQTSEMTTWGMATDLTWQLGGGWRARALFNYGRGTNVVNNDMVNNDAFVQGVGKGLINPYNLLDPTNNPAAVAAVLDWRNYGKGENELINYRAIVDGPLFDLPGGTVNAALGAEYLIEDFAITSGLGSRLTNTGPLRGSGHPHRNTKALFGEVFIPLVGADNREKSGIYSLALSISGRYDSYSDFGGTFNPKFAVTLEPVEWLKIRANWSKSFQASSLADKSGVVPNAITVVSRVFAQKPGFPSGPTQVTAFVGGGGEDLRPQKATIWTVGADIKVPFYRNLTLSATYWNIKFKDLIAIPPVTSTTLFRDYPTLAQTAATPGGSLTAADLQRLMDLAPLNNSQLSSYLSHPQDVYVLIDGRRANFSALNTSGLDFSARLDVPTGFGSIFARLDGSYTLTRKEAPITGLPFTSNVDNFSRLKLSTTLGAKAGGFRGQITWLHSAELDIVPSATNLFQSQIDSYNTFNLFASYDFGGEGLTKDFSVTLNIDNLFDTNPPFSRSGTSGYANGFTLGRLVQFGVRKRF